MQRSAIGLDEVADWRNLVAAFHNASRGKAGRPEVRAFADNLDAELSRMRERILGGNVVAEHMKSFWIRDPKLRLIHAPSFRDRVLHHAVMALAGPPLERALVFDTYACRTGKGALAAILRCHHHARRYPVFVKIDIRGYFPSIDHGVLGALLSRRFKDRGFLHLLMRIVGSHESVPGKGLPIGALTSQHFANFYLAGLDRFLLEQCGARGMVRYMDDVVWWCDGAQTARDILGMVERFVRDRLLLEIKQPIQIGRSAAGMMFCGFRILPGTLRLSRRRRQRYSARRHWWENAFATGQINARKLQAGYDSALAITAHANARAWRREQLRRRPLAAQLLSI